MNTKEERERDSGRRQKKRMEEHKASLIPLYSQPRPLKTTYFLEMCKHIALIRQDKGLFR